MNRLTTKMWFLLFFISILNPITATKPETAHFVAENGQFKLKSGLPEDLDDPIAWASFKNDINSTGWAQLELHTNQRVNDSVQAYAAGFLEGSLTRQLMQMHWTNLISDYCDGQANYCDRLKQFLQDNLIYLNNQIAEHRSNDPYWHQVALILEQVAGLEDGFHQRKPAQPTTNVSVMGLFLLNMMGDLDDLEYVLNKSSDLRRQLGYGHCSALIKLLPNGEDLFVAQDTWNVFGSMLRILKLYDFAFHSLPNHRNKLVPGHRMSFSSYPGVIQSGDDFYSLSSGLVAIETTIGNNNPDLYKTIKPKGIVPEWIRALVANRLANDGLKWSKTFSLFNSGTYNNQWMIVDYNKFTAGSTQLDDGLLYVLEQLPVFVEYQDMTDFLRNQTYWPSYNVPYFPFIFNVSGTENEVKKFGDWFTYDKTPRALIFKREHSNVRDLDSMTRLMRYNDFRNDPLSRCNCTPPFSAENAIAARSDLNPANGRYPFGALGHRQHGATDMKLTNANMQRNLQFIAISGPTNDQQPPFQWSKSDFARKVKHVGHPDLWDFDPVTPRWM